MMNILLVAAAFAASQYQYPSTPPASPPQDAGVQGFDAAPFAQVYRKCFDEAERETKAAATDVKQQKFDACRGQHDAIVDHVTAKLDGSEAAQVRRALHRSLSNVEKSYAKRMGVALPASE